MKQHELSSPYRGVLGWIDGRLPLPSMLDCRYLKFRVPENLNYF
ncbi:MAG: hypothetical protein AAF732_08180 [Pseudomonadota bacterium]